MAGGEAMDRILTEKLIEILNREISVYENIHKLSKEKTDVIIAGKVSELEGITRLEQSIILKLGKLEEEREELVEQLAAQMKIQSADVTLEGLIKLLPREQAGKLKACRDALTEILSNIRDANVLNSKLIKNSLDYIDFSINVLTNAGSTGNYGNSGRTENPKKKNFFDLKL